MGYLGRRIGKSQNQGDSNPGGADGAVGGGILDLFAHGYFERQGDIYNDPGLPIPTGIEASGGVVSTYTVGPAIYKAHIFTGSGEFDVSSIGSYGAGVEYLLVAGGGGTAKGQDGRSGGSGAGGFLTGTANVSTSPYAIVVGAGGAGGGPYASPGQSNNGGNSTGLSATAYGGGGGGYNDPNAVSNGSSGGSGGGGWYVQNGTGGKGVYPGSTYVDAPRQGYDGSPGFNQPEYGGGGGGAGGAGARRTGGAGAPNVYAYGPTSPVTYAAGGEANNYPNIFRNNSGAAGTGNGGSGHASGGSGVAIIRYQIGTVLDAKATGGSVSFYNNKTIHVFTSSGDFNVTDGPISAEFFIVAGGGGGGFDAAGGGGGGGIVHHPGLTVANGPYAVTVGAGGQGSTTQPVKGSTGIDSKILFPTTYQARGGGGGVSRSNSPGEDGGSGGGGARQNGGGSSPIFPFSNPGATEYGSGGGTAGDYAAGGGGAGTAGQPYPSTGTMGWGGAGIQAPPTFRDPNARYGGNIPGGHPSGQDWGFSGGGGGGGYGVPEGSEGGSYVPGSPGRVPGGPYYGAGNGALDPPAPTPNLTVGQGLSNTGGGGGGGNNSPSAVGGNGGSGIIIIAYPT